MAEIIPAILTNDPAELMRLLGELKAAGVTRVHIDILDDTLVPGHTVTGYDQLMGHEVGMEVDVHLMVKQPAHHLMAWQHASADRFIVHVECDQPLHELIDYTHERQKELWVAINPETSLERITHLSTSPDGAMFMTVHPGKQGAEFLPEVLDRIRDYAAVKQGIPIMVDGGITPHTATQCVAAGAHALVSGSYIIQSANPAQAMKLLQDAAQ
jgi:ribulose-phosphate 3-epimerase